MSYRTEEDFLGKVKVPEEAYYGAFTVRAANTFKLSGQKVDLRLIYSYILIKKAAALANNELGVLDNKIVSAILKACAETLSGKFDDQFILDAFQAGAGTPTHMNVNEVIANRANEILGGKKGEYKFVHPNNHINAGQSSNDVTPTAIRITALKEVKNLVNEIEELKKSFEKKSKRYAKLTKTGRTHLQDAVPITYGQIFDAYAKAIRDDIYRIEYLFECMTSLGLGGTAVGTGINAHPEFKETVIKKLSKISSLKLKKADNSVQTTQDMNVFLMASAALRSYAITINRIANDLRLLASGPKSAIAEIILPPIEPGSSIMPGKINPSVPEAVNMICNQVIAYDHAILLAANGGQLELNFFTPAIAFNLMKCMDLLKNATKILREKCIEGLQVDEKMCKHHLENSFAYAAAFNPYLGYSVVSRIVTEAYSKGISLRQIIVEKHLLTEKEINKIINSI